MSVPVFSSISMIYFKCLSLEYSPNLIALNFNCVFFLSRNRNKQKKSLIIPSMFFFFFFVCLFVCLFVHHGQSNHRTNKIVWEIWFSNNVTIHLHTHTHTLMNLKNTQRKSINNKQTKTEKHTKKIMKIMKTTHNISKKNWSFLFF